MSVFVCVCCVFLFCLNVCCACLLVRVGLFDRLCDCECLFDCLNVRLCVCLCDCVCARFCDCN